MDIVKIIRTFTLNKKIKVMKKAINLTPEQKEEFESRVKYLAKTEDAEYALDEAGNILARVITNDEAEFIEDVEDFGYNAEEVEEYAQVSATSFLYLEFADDNN